MKKLALFCLILASFYGCSSVPITGRRQLNLVSDQEVLTLSLQQYGDFIKTAKKSTDAKATAMVTRVGSKIADAVQAYYKSVGQEDALLGYAWEFTLVDDPQVNAFCMPGGKIVVYSGILPFTQDELGLAVVVGHEVAHAVAKHANERMSQQMLAQYGAAGLGSILSKSSSAVQTIGQSVFGLGTQYGALLPFSRQQEIEADHLGLIFMAIAGYTPEAALPFWQRMSQQGSAAPEFMSTHPSDNTRIANIQKEIPEAMQYYTSIWGSNKTNTTTPSKTTNTNNNWHF